MKAKLTKRRVEAAKPGETLWDGALPGFGLRVTASGARSYVLKYRRGPVQRWLTIGRHGAPWTPDTARSKARKLIGQIELGNDPAQERLAEREAETLAAFAARYLDTHARPHKKPSSIDDDERNLKNHILPALGRLRMRDITRGDVAGFVHSLRATPIAANRCRALLSHMFKKAEAWGIRPDGSNPTRHVEKFKETRRERFLSPEELNRLGGALADADGRNENPYAMAAIRLLLFTGARLSEILKLEWADVDFEGRLLRLSDSKTGAKTIALGAPAIQLLAALPRQEGNPHVICGARTGASLVNLQKPWHRIRKAANLDDVRIHDLRHSFASVAVAGGMSLPLIGALLGHSQPQTTARYAHLADDPRIAAAETVATTIAAQMSGKPGKVVPLR